jgi:gastric triacylglycerol lipase
MRAWVLLCAFLLLAAAASALAQQQQQQQKLELVSVPRAPHPNVTDIIRGYGYRCDDYEAETEDGYLLSVQRIYPNAPGGRKGVVFLQHGLTDNAAGFVLNPPNQALPFILADNGYEVFLGNNRGNGYSMKHKKYTVNDIAFWQFSFDEMAKYDLPAQINTALKISGAASLTYIGHSQGTIQAFAGFSSNHSIADRVNLFVALAPVAYVGHIEALILKLVAHIDPLAAAALLGVKEFDLPSAIKKLIPNVCDIYPRICNNVLESLMGPSDQINQSRLSYYLNYEPNPTSVMNLLHWAQGANKDTFARYDWGLIGNLKHYGQVSPPPYRLSEMPPRLPVALFSGGADYLADPKDVARLKQELKPPAVYMHDEPAYSHIDFLWAINANQRIYSSILLLIKMYTQA